MKKTRIERKPVSINPKRLAAYATAGAAAVLGAENANADITHVVVNVNVADTVLGGGGPAIALDFGDNQDWTVALGHGLGATNAATGYAIFGDFSSAANDAQISGFVAGSYNYANNVAYNANVNALAFLAGGVQGTMAFNAGYGNDQFLAPGIGFLGVRFNTNQHGWIRVNMSGAPLNSFTVVDYAWADANETIVVGAIPEPGSLGLLALGAVGVTSWRRRRMSA